MSMIERPLFQQDVKASRAKHTKLAKTKVDSYEEFVEKFKPKKTTDDCYTPKETYDAVLRWVRENADIEGLEVVRPFYPGGDYKSVDYTNAVVIDNPPFSILAEIKRFYFENGVSFFLFAPHLTLFTTDMPVTHLVTDEVITYENGAIVNTDFVSNLFGDLRIWGCPTLAEVIRDAEKQRKKEKQEANKLPKYKYPTGVLTVSHIAPLVNNGIELKVMHDECAHVRRLDSQVDKKKTIFGAGYFVSESVARQAEEARRQAEEARAVVWELSEREKQIIRDLG